MGAGQRYKGGMQRRLEAWLYTGPLGHLAAGLADLAQALAAHRRGRR
jgi:hypothetical protein